MRTVVCNELGPLGGLAIEERGEPTPGEGQVVVDVRAAGVNFVACPADFAGREGAHLRLSDLALDSESLERSTLAVHEWLGLLWLCVRGVG